MDCCSLYHVVQSPLGRASTYFPSVRAALTCSPAHLLGGQFPLRSHEWLAAILTTAQSLRPCSAMTGMNSSFDLGLISHVRVLSQSQHRLD